MLCIEKLEEERNSCELNIRHIIKDETALVTARIDREGMLLVEACFEVDGKLAEASARQSVFMMIDAKFDAVRALFESLEHKVARFICSDQPTKPAT